MNRRKAKPSWCFPLFSVLALILPAVFPSAFAFAESRPYDDALFIDKPATYGDTMKWVENRVVVRKRSVDINFNVISENGDPDSVDFDNTYTILFNLFDDVAYPTVLDRVERDENGKPVWVGRVEGVEESLVTVATTEDELAATITLPWETFQVRPTEDGDHEIRELSADVFPFHYGCSVELNSNEEGAIELTNQERLAAGLDPYFCHDLLTASARGHSTDMAEQNFFSHTSPDGRTFDQRIRNAGYNWWTCGENIAASYSSPQMVMTAWMSSPPHRANILNSSFCEIGVGFIRSFGSYYPNYWTQNFGSRNGTSGCAVGISGRIFDASGNGIANVRLTFSNGGGEWESDENGYYIAALPSGWSGTLTPQKALYTFDPPNRTYTNTLSDRNSQDFTGNAGQTYTITATSDGNGAILPSGVTVVGSGGSQTYHFIPNQDYHVSNVVVDGVSLGSMSSYTFSNVTSNHQIAVEFSVESYTLRISLAGTGYGYTSPSVGIHSYAAGATVTLIPYPQQGSVFSGWSGDASGTGQTTVVLDSDKVVTATFDSTGYIINATAGTGGSISPSGVVSVAEGSNRTFMFTPNSGYVIADVVVDGSSVGTPATYTFTNIQANHTISVSFKAQTQTYTINASAGPGGSISPSGVVSVAEGSNRTFMFTPNSGYVIADVVVDGSSVGTPPSYTFANVQADHTISVSFQAEAQTHTLTMSVTGTGQGAVTPAPGQHTYNHGETVTVTATPAANSTFAGWSGDASGTAATATVTMNSDKSVTAAFNVKTFAIAPSAGPGGTVSPSSPISVSYGSNAVFLFTPNTGYSIEDVKVDGVSIGAVAAYTFTNVQADHTISVSFKKQAITRTLHVFKAGPGEGTIIPGIGTHVYEQGEVVELSAVPDEKSVFVGWSGNVSGPGPKTLVMDTDKIVIAIFLLKTYTITPQAGPGGIITPSSVRTVSHGNDAAFVMIPFTGYQVGSVFVDGVNIGAVTTYTFQDVDANHTISVQFKSAAPSYTLTVTKTGSGDGDVVPVVGQHSYPVGETVLLSATPAAGSAFAGWSGDASGGALRTSVTMNSNKTVTASFVIASYVINATAGEHGHISPSGPVFVDLGGSQTFSIAPDAHYHIDDVRVDGVSVGPVGQYTFTNVTASHTIEALFAADTHTLTIAAVGTGTGTVSPGVGQHMYDYGATVTLTATPGPGSAFAGWTGSVTGTDNPVQLVMDADKSVVAQFSEGGYTITADSGDNGAIVPAGAVFVAPGGSMTFEMTPDPGHHISAVLVDGTDIGPASSYTFSDVDADHTISVIFEADAYIIMASAGVGGSITPEGTVGISHGEDRTFSIVPDTGFSIEDVLVDGVSVGAVETYTFHNVTGDHTIEASFAETYSHLITAGAQGNGDISPSGATLVGHGEDSAFHMIPDDGYAVEDVVVDGVSLGPVSSYTFGEVGEDHTITAFFTEAKQTAYIDLGRSGSAPGHTVSIPAALTNEKGLDIVTLSMTVRYDTNALSDPAVILGPAAEASGKTVEMEESPAGVLNIRFNPIIVITPKQPVPSNSPIENGILCTLVFQIDETGSEGKLGAGAAGGRRRICSAGRLPWRDEYGVVTVQEALTGDCDRDGTVSAGEVDSAVSMFLEESPVRACADTNGDQRVGIGEIQEIVNNFIGVSPYVVAGDLSGDPAIQADTLKGMRRGMPFTGRRD